MGSFLRNLIIFLLLVTLSSCYYLPFVKYYRTDKQTGFPPFSASDYFKGAMNEYRTNYDVTLYDWLIEPFPDNRRVNGRMKIAFDVLESEPVILLDLQNRLKIDAITSSLNINGWNKKDDLLYITFDKELPVGENHWVEIAYHGKPALLKKEGPIQWKTDTNGKPWISTITEGIGPHFIMPCKHLLYDEPDRCIIRVVAPAETMAVANGKLDSVTTVNQKDVYHWSVSNPINIYNISFNIGDFVKIEKSYVDINGMDRMIDVYALSYDSAKATDFYEQTSMHMSHLESLYGVFPWWEDGCKFVESTLSTSAMEHQSAISMGSILTNDYRPPDSLHVNLTLIHELSHEWWGNSITAKDYCDMWLHEGFASYSEALMIEKYYKSSYYDHYFYRYMAPGTANERPVIKPCGVQYNSWIKGSDSDIYNKGALVVHTYRRQLNNDSLFFHSLKEANIKFRKSNITTDQFIAFLNRQTNTDFTELFDYYLRTTDVPVLQFKYDSMANELDYKWKQTVPFEYKVIVRMGENRKDIWPNTDLQTLKIDPDIRPDLNIGDFGYVLFERIE